VVDNYSACSGSAALAAHRYDIVRLKLDFLGLLRDR